MVDIDQMMDGMALEGIGGQAVTPFARRPQENDGLTDRLKGPVRIGRQPFTLPIAKLTDLRHLDRVIKKGDCETNGPSFGAPDDLYCPTPGNVLSLFPATYTYVTATVTDPQARYWNPELRRYVDGPLSTRFFFQVAGEVPDANRNGVDDLIDIREGTSRDENRNGIPDEAEFSRRSMSQTTAMGVFSNMFQPWPLAGSALR